MADLSVLLTAPVDFIVHATPAANSAATATQAADAGGATPIVTGITISANGTVAAAVLVQLIADNGGTNVVLWQAYLPAAGVAPIDINFKNPLKGLAGKNVALNVPALGAAISGSASVRGFMRQVG